MTTSVVILNWNGIDHLKTYLPSVVESAQSDSYSLFIIDNGSTDGSVAWINEHFKSVNVIKLDKNFIQCQFRLKIQKT